MSNNSYITNAALPLNQNFRLLKQLALEYVQQHSDREWTNLNPSDPGITILDQVCYALTELGYCTSFPIEDILADEEGNIAMEDRFYQPGEILTTAPVTINDYRRYLIDGVEGVTNAVIIPTRNSYQVYLQIASSLIHDATNICKAAFYYLNKSRNLGELFTMPEPLQTVSYPLPATRIDIDNSENVYNILKALHDAICNFIFPVVTQSAFPVDENYNGPLLLHGPIPNQALGNKRDTLSATDIVLMAENIPGILKVSTGGNHPFYANDDQLIMVDLPASVNKQLQVWCNGHQLNIAVARLQQVLNSTAAYTADVIQKPILPTGQYRDIANYYPIQNTFPDIFAVGPNAVNANASPFQVAQSRQLKGYLTLFDQVLANQFAQLAGVGKLFSFSNTDTGLWSGEKPSIEKVWPAGYLSFSPTYFFQPLYNVPHIRPLLKGNEIFNFSEVEQDAKEQAHKSWLAYQADPYNPYIRGLLDAVEDNADNLERRNNILDHLLARHGESPLAIDTCAEAYTFTGNRLQGLIIIKSNYLQNLGLLSYNRQRAYNYLGATKLDATLQDPPAPTATKEEKLYPRHFIQYSALELKLSLLFALHERCLQFIAAHNNEPEAQIAWWLCHQRRGMILVEEALLPGICSGNGIWLFLPDFLFPVDQRYKDRLHYFLQQELPTHVPFEYYFLDSDTMSLLIPAYCDWHNSLIYQEKDPDPETAQPLLNLLTKIRSTNG